MTTLILARNIREARHWAFMHMDPNDALKIVFVQAGMTDFPTKVERIVRLDTFEKRRDRFAILSRLKPVMRRSRIEIEDVAGVSDHELGIEVDHDPNDWGQPPFAEPGQEAVGSTEDADDDWEF